MGGSKMPNDVQVTGQSERILNAAFNCISSKGYANVSLRDIAEEAGVVLSQLNYYYKNKEGLLTEVIKTLAQKYLSEIEWELRKGNLAKEKLHNIINYFKKILEEQPGLFKLLYDVTGMALWSSKFRELLQGMYANLSNLIEKYIVNDYSNNKSEKQYSSKALSRMILGTFIGTAIQIVINQEEDSIDSLNAIETIFE
jgi:Transcriptional regulator